MIVKWSGKSHNFTKKEKIYLFKMLDNSDVLTQGPELNKFENSLRNYLGSKNVFCTSSAASALEIIADLINIKKGDEIIIPAHTYCSTAIPFAKRGAKIVWADISLKTRTIDFFDVKKKITKKTKAIVVVDLYGYAVDINEFKKLRKNIKIIHDCAQSIGASFKKKKSGMLADFACYSFHSQKNITTLGEGGAIYVKNKKLANAVKGLRHNGHRPYSLKRRYYWKPAMVNLELDIKNVWPHKFTLSEIQCAAGNLLLKRLDSLNNIRIKRAKKIIKELHGETFNFNIDNKNRRHVYHLLTAYVKPSKNISRDKIIDLLYKKYNIQSIIQFYPLYKYPLFKKMKLGNATCPKTELFYKNMISFPFHVWLSEKQINYMILAVKKCIDELKNN